MSFFFHYGVLLQEIKMNIGLGTPPDLALANLTCEA
jgi:hypothetical protein